LTFWQGMACALVFFGVLVSQDTLPMHKSEQKV